MALTRISSAGIQTSPTFSGDVRIGLGATLESTGNAYVTGITTLGIGATGDVYLYNPANSVLSGTQNSVYGWKAKTYCAGLQVNSTLYLSRSGSNGLSLGYNNATGSYITANSGFMNISVPHGPPMRFYASCFEFRHNHNARQSAFFNTNGAIQLNHNGNKKFETTNEGVCITGIATVTGNLSVGGTVTYEDVSNVDSIGIVTARQDVHIGENIVHIGDTDTKIRFTNDVIQLQAGGTNRIQTTSIGAQVCTTLLLYGAAGNPGRLRLQEGGALSEIRGVRNSDNNSLLYFDTEISGSTSTRLIIDENGHLKPSTDSTYNLGTSANRWSNVFADAANVAGDIDGTGNLTLTSTDAGSSAAPELTLDRNSASPADSDYLGQIKFSGKHSGGGTVNYAKITGKILDVSQGTEDGILEFMLRKNGSNNIAARFRSDSLQLLNGTSLTVAGTIDGTGAIGSRLFQQDSNKNMIAGTNAGLAITVTTSPPPLANILIGCCAGSAIRSQCYSVAIGVNAARCVAAGSGQDTYVGSLSGARTGCCGGTGSGNAFFGFGTGNCGYNHTANTLIGYHAGKGHPDSTGGTGGSCNVMVGYHAGSNYREGSNNVLIGRYVGASSSTASNNIAMGNQPLFYNLTGSGNVSLGSQSMEHMLTGNLNIGISCNALHNTTTGSHNIALGHNSLYCNTTDSNSIAIGCLAGYAATCGPNIMIGGGAGCKLNATKNVMMGIGAGNKSTDATGNTFLGHSAGACNFIGGYNTFIGCKAGIGNTTGCANISVGQAAGPHVCGATGSANISMGTLSGKCISSAQCNISIGQCAACCLSTGGCNVAIGKCAGKGYASGSINVSIGNESGSQSGNSSGSGNITLGAAGSCITSGSSNIAIGCAANMGTGNVTGDGNISMGAYTGRRLTSGDHNQFIGGSAGRYTTTGGRNVFIGIFAGYCNVSGGCNVAIGCNAGRGSAAACDNISMGRAALYINEIGSGNVAIGHSASFGLRGSNNVSIGATSGPGNSCNDAHDNIFVGRHTGAAVTSGNNNIMMGMCAGTNTGIGSENVFIGSCAGFCNTEGRCNVFIGKYAGKCNCTGNYNIAIGDRAGCCLRTGNTGVLIGLAAGMKLCSGNSNIFIGNQTGICASTACENVIMGTVAGKALSGGVNNVALGKMSGCKLNNGSNNVLLGNCSGYCLTGKDNVMLGMNSGFHRSGNQYCRNVLIGKSAGDNATTLAVDNFDILIGFGAGYDYTGSCSIGIGHSVNLPINDGMNQLAIGQYNDHWIVGDCNYNVGIGTTKPIAKLDVNVGSSVSAFNIEGSEGQLFSVTNNLSSGSIFAVNDITGLPSIDVDADGTIQLAPRGTSEFVGIGTTLPTSKLHVVANDGDDALKVGTALTVKGSGQVVFSGVTTFRGNNNPGGRGAIHLPYNCMLVLGDSYLRGAIYNTGAQLVFQALNTYKFRVWDGGGMEDWMNVHGPGGSVRIGGCHMGVAGQTNRTHLFMTTPHTIAMCSSVPDSSTLTKRFELDSYGINLTGITTITGNLNTTGIVTASHFHGDGSNLTGITASSLNISSFSADSNKNIFSGGTCSGCNLKTDGDTHTNGCHNIMLGACAGKSMACGDHNVLIGEKAGCSLVQGTFGCNALANVFIGRGTGASAEFGCFSVAIGCGALESMKGQGCNIAFGRKAGQYTCCGTHNFFAGNYAAKYHCNSQSNIAIGERSISCNTSTSGNNIALGLQAMVGSSTTTNNTGGHNVAIGQYAGRFLTSGANNVFLKSASGGCISGNYNYIVHGGTAFTSGSNNVIFGELAAHKCAVTGSRNFIVGSCAGCAISSGKCNIILGSNAARTGVLTGDDNIVIGQQAASIFSSAGCNIILGRDAAQNITTGQRNIVMGLNVDPPAADSDDTLSIGCNTSRWISGDSSFNTTLAGIATVYAATGIVSATSFSGDGSNLTGIGAAVQSGAPSSANQGDLWYDTDDGRIFVYYNDGSSAQWVDASPNGTPTDLVVEGTTALKGTATTRAIVPEADSTYDIGTSSNRFADVYADTLHGDGSNLTGVQGIPSGGIIMWSGATSAIPSGWVLCDGQNSTPDLRNRFVVGASDSTGDTSYPGVSPDATGGSADATLPSHYHNFPGDDQLSNANGLAGWSNSHDGNFSYDATSTTSGGGKMWRVSTKGSSATNANLPPYYALAYIMKT